MALQYQYDNLSRLTGMQQTTCTWVSGGACGSWDSPSTVASATYNAAGQITNMTYDIFTETRSYNTLMQLTQETATAYFGTFTAKNMSYAYSSTQNNGRITSSTDGITGETITYTYDALNRLISAQGSPGGFSESYTYDGFGNMGSGFSYLTNRTSTQSADANGNSTASGYTWDMENRLISPAFQTWYAYDPRGKRVFTGVLGNTTTCELDFYSIGGQKLAAYPCQYDQNGIFSTQTPKYNVYYGGKLIRSNNVTVVTDRLGSVRGTSNSEVMRYTPYGTERTSTPDGREKWGTYFRDSGTGNDYADQRYKGVGQAAFLSPDPSGFYPVRLSNPTSWNHYLYSLGDPINLYDPAGRIACDPDIDDTCGNDPDCGDAFSPCYADDDGGGDGDPCASSTATFCVTTTDDDDDDDSDPCAGSAATFCVTGTCADPSAVGCNATNLGLVVPTPVVRIPPVADPFAPVPWYTSVGRFITNIPLRLVGGFFTVGVGFTSPCDTLSCQGLIPPPDITNAEHTKNKSRSKRDKHQRKDSGDSHPPNYVPYRKYVAPPDKKTDKPPYFRKDRDTPPGSGGQEW